MKSILICITALLIFTAPVFSELTVQDLEKIRSIVKESEDGLKEYIDFKVSEMDKRLNIVFGFVVALISLVVVVVGIPQVIMVWRGRGERTQAAEIQELRREIETLKQHIASL